LLCKAGANAQTVPRILPAKAGQNASPGCTIPFLWMHFAQARAGDFIGLIIKFPTLRKELSLRQRSEDESGPIIFKSVAFPFQTGGLFEESIHQHDEFSRASRFAACV
jgi:hypothetical protein